MKLKEAESYVLRVSALEKLTGMPVSVVITGKIHFVGILEGIRPSGVLSVTNGSAWVAFPMSEITSLGEDGKTLHVRSL